MKNLPTKASLALASIASFVAASPAYAVVGVPDYAATVTYMETNGPTLLIAIGGVMMTLAGVAVLIKWGKASVFG